MNRPYPKANRRKGRVFSRVEARSEDDGVVGQALRRGRAMQPQTEKMPSLTMSSFGIGSNKKEVIKKMISRGEIARKITQLAKQISKDYKNKNPFFICLLKGGWVFSADLLRKIKIPVLIDFLMVSSYEDKIISTGKVEIKSTLSSSIEGKDVLLVEDIVDSGLTVSKVKEYLHTLKPNTVKICTLLDKPSRRRVEVELEYVGFEIPDKFVVGYGIDYANKYRQLPYIGYVEFPGGKPSSERKAAAAYKGIK